MTNYKSPQKKCPAIFAIRIKGVNAAGCRFGMAALRPGPRPVSHGAHRACGRPGDFAPVACSLNCASHPPARSTHGCHRAELSSAEADSIPIIPRRTSGFSWAHRGTKGPLDSFPNCPELPLTLKGDFYSISKGQRYPAGARGARPV